MDMRKDSSGNGVKSPAYIAPEVPIEDARIG
jgi:hypothetical protein